MGGEIVGADALQLYRDLPVLSAAPNAEELAQVPHHLVGAVDAAEGWSVGRWLRAATEALAGVAERGRDAVVVGGTGLYFRALTQGLAEVPEVPAEARRQAEAELQALDEVVFRARLEEVDPLAAQRISAGDRQRLVRAWEVWAATGKALTDWQSESSGGLEDGSWTAVVLDPPRDELYARCDLRLAAMVEAGVLEEVRALAARKLDPALPALKAVGFREFAAHLAGDLPLPAAIEAAQRETRRYAKRQATWMRGQMAGWPRIETLAPQEQWRQFLALNPGLTA